MEVILFSVDGAGISVSVAGAAGGVGVAFGVRSLPKLHAITNSPAQSVIVNKFFRDMNLLLFLQFGLMLTNCTLLRCYQQELIMTYVLETKAVSFRKLSKVVYNHITI
jgi:hypothetical protein